MQSTSAEHPAMQPADGNYPDELLPRDPLSMDKLEANVAACKAFHAWRKSLPTDTPAPFTHLEALWRCDVVENVDRVAKLYPDAYPRRGTLDSRSAFVQAFILCDKYPISASTFEQYQAAAKRGECPPITTADGITEAHHAVLQRRRTASDPRGSKSCLIL